MASLLDRLNQTALSTLETVQSDAGVSPQITVGGFTWPCVRGSKNQGQAQGEGGYVFVYDYTIHIRKNAIASDGATVFSSIALPLPESLVTDQGESLRIAKIDSAQGSHVVLYLVDPNRQ